MPLEYKKYGCKFKCGFKHLSDRRKVELHEKKCWYNPKNKTCKTCRNEEYWFDQDLHRETDGHDYPGEGQIRDCKLNCSYTSAVIYRLYLNRDSKNMRICHESEDIRPMINCEMWNMSCDSAVLLNKREDVARETEEIESDNERREDELHELRRLKRIEKEKQSNERKEALIKLEKLDPEISKILFPLPF